MRKAMFAVSVCVPGVLVWPDMLVITGDAPCSTLNTSHTRQWSVRGVMITNPGKKCSNNTTLSQLSQAQALSSQHNNARTNGAVFLRIRKIKNPNFSLLSA